MKKDRGFVNGGEMIRAILRGWGRVPCDDTPSQEMLEHIRRVRSLQGIPAVYAVISSPSLQRAHLMDGLSATIGRHTQDDAAADIDLGSVRRSVSRSHVRIEYHRPWKCYTAVLLSKRGMYVRYKGAMHFVCSRGDRVRLSNPAVLSIGGTLVCIQLYRIDPAKEAHPLGQREAPKRPLDAVAEAPLPHVLLHVPRHDKKGRVVANGVVLTLDSDGTAI